MIAAALLAKAAGRTGTDASLLIAGNGSSLG
jgi:hypothetical protein